MDSPQDPLLLHTLRQQDAFNLNATKKVSSHVFVIPDKELDISWLGKHFEIQHLNNVCEPFWAQDRQNGIVKQLCALKHGKGKRNKIKSKIIKQVTKELIWLVLFWVTF